MYSITLNVQLYIKHRLNSLPNNYPENEKGCTMKVLIMGTPEKIHRHGKSRWREV